MKMGASRHCEFKRTKGCRSSKIAPKQVLPSKSFRTRFGGWLFVDPQKGSNKIEEKKEK